MVKTTTQRSFNIKLRGVPQTLRLLEGPQIAHRIRVFDGSISIWLWIKAISTMMPPSYKLVYNHSKYRYIIYHKP